MAKRKEIISHESSVPTDFDAMVEGALAEESSDDTASASPVTTLTPEEGALTEEASPQPFFSDPLHEALPPRGNFFESPGMRPDVAPPDMFLPKREAELLLPQLSPDGRETMGFDRMVRVDSMDPLTEALGTKHYRTTPIFDWCRKGLWNTAPVGDLDSRPRHTFTRWYFQVRVLVDIFSSGTPAVYREIEEKARAIHERGLVEGQRIGYLPIVRGAFVSESAITSALGGGILHLQDKRNVLGVSA